MDAWHIVHLLVVMNISTRISYGIIVSYFIDTLFKPWCHLDAILDTRISKIYCLVEIALTRNNYGDLLCLLINSYGIGSE